MIFEEIKSMRSEFINELKSLNNRMDSFDNRMDSFDNRMDSLNNRMDSFDNRMDSMQLEIKGLKEGQQELRDDLINRMTTSQQELKEDLIKRIDELKDHLIDVVHEAAGGYKRLTEKEMTKKIEIVENKNKELESRINANTIDISILKSKIKA